MIDELLSPDLTVQLVGLKLLEILSSEFANQYALAVAASQPEPETWKADVYFEVDSNPINKFKANEDRYTSVINITKDLARIQKTASSRQKNHQFEMNYRIYVYACALAEENARADRLADARLCQTLGIMYKILGASEYTTLGTSIEKPLGNGKFSYPSLVTNKDFSDLKFYDTENYDGTKVIKTAELNLTCSVVEQGAQHATGIVSLIEHTANSLDPENNELFELLKMNIPRN